MSDYLWRVSIEPEYRGMTPPSPVYCVAADKDAALKYVENHLRSPNKTGKVQRLARALGMKMFSGK
jgi:hypothetical protein